MHDAFQLVPVLEQLPVQVESIVVTEDGVSVRLIDTKKSFANQAIRQLEVIREAGLLVSLAEDVVTLYSLQTYTQKMLLKSTKGAQMMTVYTGVDHVDGIPVIVSKLAVIVKKKLIVFEWRDAQFTDNKEFPLNEKIRSFQFSTSNMLILSTTKEFMCLQLSRGQWIDLLAADAASLRSMAKPQPQGTQQLPTSQSSGSGGGGGWGSWTMGLIGNAATGSPNIVKMPDEELLLCREDIGVFISSAGKLSKNHDGPIQFSSTPTCITYTPLYVITTQSKNDSDGAKRHNVVVQNIVDHSIVQELDLQQETPLRVTNGGNGKQVWIAGANTIWHLFPVDIHKQVEDVLQICDFEQAHNLVTKAENIFEEDREHLIQKIQWLQARWLFREEAEYEDALGMFSKLNATPTEPIALYPKSISGDLAEEYDNNLDEGAKDDEKDLSVYNDKSGTKTPTRPPSKGTQSEPSNSQKSTKKRRVVWRDGLLSMMRYLTEHRRRIQKAFSNNEQELVYLVRITQNDNEDIQDLPDVPPVPKNPDREMRENNFAPLLQFQLINVPINIVAMAQLVDTTLLKLYIECSPSLIGSLLRVKNHCDIEESEALLLKHKKFKELVDLYHGNELHRKALQLLMEHGQNKESVDLYGTKALVNYLQRLPASLFDLILEYVSWPLSYHQKDADASIFIDGHKESVEMDQDLETHPSTNHIIYKVFADGRPATLNFPREKVVSFLSGFSPYQIVCYLEYAIDEWKDTSPSLHNSMALALLQIVKDAIPKSPNKSIDITDPRRQKLIAFLKSSKYYSAEKILLNLPAENLYEERMHVLARLGQFSKALELAVFHLKKLSVGEEYCKEYVEKCENIYMLFLTVLTGDVPADVPQPRPQSSQASSKKLQKLLDNECKKRLNFSLHLIASYPSHFPLGQTLASLPPNTVLQKDFISYFKTQLRLQSQEQRETAILANLGTVERFQLRCRLKELQEICVVIGDTSVCSHCLKRIGKGVAFAVLPGKSQPIHLSCWQRRKNAEAKAKENKPQISFPNGGGFKQSAN
ncbi:Vacuolar morphogenesis protein 6 [Mycoemilia scoparia]|uniref:Vacuolar morphogenesis protein 6 n=1 Tax=Mycoemilia scoparia TaxID=417184 RepID=A0A9W8DW12_9FUNG|nr:Vacuolar morphogenesis protein 6 [Mycoemilia scoparia]